MVNPLSPDDIPTVTDLYAKNELPPAEEPAAKPSASINARVSTIQHDITKLAVGAIVNAANSSLLGGGGVDGAIHKAAGPQLLDECAALKGCDTGSAKITKGYKLPAAHVVHAVGPVFSGRREAESAANLAGCYRTALELAVEHDCKSIAFSAISTGIYGYPSSRAADKACETVRKFLDGDDGDKIERVIFCNFLDKDVTAYENSLPKFFPKA